MFTFVEDSKFNLLFLLVRNNFFNKLNIMIDYEMKWYKLKVTLTFMPSYDFKFLSLARWGLYMS